MKGLSLAAIASACGGTCYGPEELLSREITGVAIDSRKIEEGFLFVPIKGARVDGHDFIEQVMEKGALCSLSEHSLGDVPYPYIVVESTEQALKDLARYYRSRLNLKVIGITGSVGKTSTKELIASVLAQKYHVLKTEGNYNNEIGLPLTIFRLTEEDEIAVLEMGIDHFGEMHRLSRIARPDICVMTNIGQCHLEFLGSREGILKAKSEIFDFMQEDGCAVLNGDDDLLSTVEQVKGKKPLFFGISSERAAQYEVSAKDVREKGILGSEAVFCHNGEKFPVHIPVPGAHMVYNALAAAAVGFRLGLTGEEIAEGIAAVQSVRGRSRIVQAGDRTLIDDCYNANPVSMKAAIDLLVQAQGRSVAVLGDMFELGEEEKELHAQVGRYCVQKGADCLICTGSLSEAMYEGALSAAEEQGRMPAGGIHHFPDRESLLAHLEKLLLPGDTVLIKASHGMGFEEVVKHLSGE